jgi:hypothetical protein
MKVFGEASEAFDLLLGVLFFFLNALEPRAE